MTVPSQNNYVFITVCYVVTSFVNKVSSGKFTQTSIPSMATICISYYNRSPSYRTDKCPNLLLVDVGPLMARNSLSWCNVAVWRSLTRRSKVSHKCSIGDPSGDNAYHGNSSMFSCSKNYVVMRAVWHLELSCRNRVTRLLTFKNGTKLAQKISSQYS